MCPVHILVAEDDENIRTGLIDILESEGYQVTPAKDGKEAEDLLVAEKFELASQKYIDNPVALHLRGMNMLFEGLKEKGSMVIVPSSALDSMNLGAIGGLTAFDKGHGA